ncbi:MAG: cobalamin-dependent protein [Opitutales bacterium]|nr:cobalamin-dependent protein [Opitutales bacterium]
MSQIVNSRSFSPRMRILLVNLNTVADPFPVFPLGLAYVREALEAEGHAVDVFDDLLEDVDAFPGRVRDFVPDVIGFSLRNIDNVRADDAVSYIEGLRARVLTARAAVPAKIVFGGAGFSIFPEEILRLTGADYGISGEGEAAFPALARILAGDGGDPADVPGLLHRRDGRIHRVPPQPAVRHACPPFNPGPAWVEAYRERGAIFNVQTQRGCPLHCSYCTYPLIEGSRRRLRDYGRVVEEMRRWRELGVRYVFVVDSVLNTTAEHMRGLGEAILAAGVEIQWGCFLRPHRINADDLRRLREAGLRHIEFGSDSFSDTMLKAYGKSFTFSMIADASAAAEAAGVHYCHFLIPGGPGETRKTLDETFERAESLPGGVFFAFPGVRVYPGTPLWHQLRAHGTGLPDNLLAPWFYIEEGLTVEEINGLLRQQSRRDPRWVPSELPAQFGALAARFRKRGIEGPLWEYFPLMNRFAGS